VSTCKGDSTGEELFTDAELKLLNSAIQERELRDDLAQLADAAWQRESEIDRLETLRETDINEYFRRGGSDRLLALLSEED
jgi:hypothetical protein